MTDEQRELMRIAAPRVLDDNACGRKVAPEALRWAQRWAQVKPLGKPLTTGEPIRGLEWF